MFVRRTLQLVLAFVSVLLAFRSAAGTMSRLQKMAVALAVEQSNKELAGLVESDGYSSTYDYDDTDNREIEVSAKKVAADADIVLEQDPYYQL
jgi:hypothetical protein